ncbi:AAA family ATPase [Chloroflexota bacterium]
MPTSDDYYQTPDGEWQLKPGVKSDYTINQINHPMLRVDDYSEKIKPVTPEMHVLTFKEIVETEGESIEYLWGNFIPAKSIILLSGEAGVGKTTLAYNLAVHTARGTEFAGLPFSRATNVLYCDLETGAALRKSKLELISDGETVDNLCYVTNLDFMKQFDSLKAVAEKRQIGLIIVDTINEAFSTRDEQDNAEANRQFSFVKRLRDEAGCSILLMHHIGKGQPGKKVYSARGASARAAAVDVVLNLLTVTEDTICLEKAKDRISGGIEKLYLRKAGEDCFEVVEQGEEQEAPALVRTQEFILRLLSEGLYHRYEFNERGRTEGFSEATIGRALERLVRAGKLVRVKKGIYHIHPLREDPRLL